MQYGVCVEKLSGQDISWKEGVHKKVKNTGTLFCRVAPQVNAESVAVLQTPDERRAEAFRLHVTGVVRAQVDTTLIPTTEEKKMPQS